MFFPWEEQCDSQVDSTNKNQNSSKMSNQKEENGCNNVKNNDEEKKSSKENSQNNQNTVEYNEIDFFANNECPSLGSLSFGEILEAPDTSQSGISAVLRYCKYKILRPYLRVLACIGLRPLKLDDVESSFCGCVFSCLYTIIIIVLLVLGYILQYLSCFRRDRGFCYSRFGVQLLTSSATVPVVPVLYGDEHPVASPISASAYHHQICFGSEMFSYWIPSALHLSAYLYTLYLFRITNNEQLQSMMERVFLSSAGPYDGMASQRRLLRILWLFIGSSIIWIVLSTTITILMLENGNILFQWVQLSSETLLVVLKATMIICTVFHDTVQATIIISYCIQAQLLKSQSQFLKGKLIHQFLTPLEWMREVAEFRTQLNYLNNALSPAICLFTILNLSRAMSGAIWLLKIDASDPETETMVVISIANMCLWLLITLAPFVQAARLTNSCITMQMVGHDIRTKPLAYNTTPDCELDSILLYASSLRLSAKLFNVPITGRCIYLTITILIIFLLTFGQSHYSQVT